MKKIFLAGHTGMVGSAIFRKLVSRSDSCVVTRTRKELDLTNQKSCFEFIKAEKPDEIILAAAKVGGINANNIYPAEFIYQNLQIQNNVIHSAHLNNVQRLLFLGSSCIYPKLAEQPIYEKALLTGKLEPTNEPYALAKIAGIKMCESYNRQYGRDYRSVMPTNLYGPGDNYHSENSHVVPALIRRFHEAKIKNSEKVTVWGSGQQMREFLYVDDMAEACLFINDLDEATYNKSTSSMISHINVGTGHDITIEELAQIIKSIVGYNGEIRFDTSKPDGAFKKVLNVNLLHSLGFKAVTSLEDGLAKSYVDFKTNQKAFHV